MKKTGKKTENSHGGPRENSGRPTVDEPRSLNLSSVRIAPSEKAKLVKSAEQAGLKLSDWVRARLGL